MNYLPQSARVAVIGGGIMGSGIAQLAATAGHEVAVFDADAEQVTRGRVQIEASLKKLVSKGALETPDGVRALQQLHPQLLLPAGHAPAPSNSGRMSRPASNSLRSRQPPTTRWVS